MTTTIELTHEPLNTAAAVAHLYAIARIPSTLDTVRSHNIDQTPKSWAPAPSCENPY